MKQRNMRRQIEALGYTLTRHGGSGHLIFDHPSGARCVAPSSPGENRSDKNTIANAKRQIKLTKSTTKENT